MLYCIGNRNQGVCKIGYTADATPAKRLKSLQTGNPHPLVVFGVIEAGTLQDEDALHDKFAGHRLTGEWFKLTQEIADHFGFPLEPVDRMWVVALTFMYKDVWETEYNNAMVFAYAPSEQEAIGEAKLKTKCRGVCVRAMAVCPTREVLAKGLALYDEAAFTKSI